MDVKFKYLFYFLLMLSIGLSGCEKNNSTTEDKQAENNSVKNTTDKSDEEPIDTHLAYIETLTKPAIHIIKTQNKTNSKLGGTPLVEAGFEWPIWQGKPLSLLLQIDLSELPKTALSDELPKRGLLSFYYDSAQRTWGFDPKDKGSWKVTYNKQLNKLKAANAPDNLTPYPQSFIMFKTIATYPDDQNKKIAKLELNDTQNDQYQVLKDEVYNQQSHHQLFGYPSVIQNDNMDLSSQLASNGIWVGNSSGYHTKEAFQLEPGRKDWKLLLQFDSDEANNIMWGDSGTLYFWIRKQDLKQLNFDKVWMKLQSY